jgi:hypothetical protein
VAIVLNQIVHTISKVAVLVRDKTSIKGDFALVPREMDIIVTKDMVRRVRTK